MEKSAGLIGQLLSFSRQDQFRPVRRDLNDYMEELYEEYVSRFPEKTELAMVREKSRLPVDIDGSRLNLALENIIGNGIDAMPGGGTITLATEKRRIGGNRFCDFCHDYLRGEWAVLTVSDGGRGIEKDFRHRIFEPFFSTKGFGTGLGLSQVSGIRSQHGGT